MTFPPLFPVLSHGYGANTPETYASEEDLYAPSSRKQLEARNKQCFEGLERERIVYR